MSPVEIWLKNLKNFWLEKNPEGAARLFTGECEYWETPFLRLRTPAEVRAAWDEIRGHEIRALDFEILSEAAGAATVRWRYDRGAVWAGLYFLRLGADGRAEYFFQTGERAER